MHFDEDSDIRKDVQHMVDTYHYDKNTTHGIKKTKDKELNESSLLSRSFTLSHI